MSGQLSHDDLERLGLLGQVVNDLGMFSVAFVKLVERSGKEDMLLAGSGTLVQARGHFGILTADHVLQNLPHDDVGLIFPTMGRESPHRVLVRADDSQKLHIGPASYSAAGPDLGLLLLQSSDIAKISSASAFYNLVSRREKVLAAPRDIRKGGWYLCGTPDEWRTESPSVRTFTKVKAFPGFCGAAPVTQERIGVDFDYLDVDIAVNGRYEGPLNFQGVSGGGLWQVVFEERDGHVRIAEHLLSGVAFYQQADDGQPHTVVYHGRRSIYATLLSKFPPQAA